MATKAIATIKGMTGHPLFILNDITSLFFETRLRLSNRTGMARIDRVSSAGCKLLNKVANIFFSTVST